ncbi:hypothetical protein ACVIRO_006529 [Rhizobium ruizarguesonis]|jgi:hypothetical protein
MSMDNTSYPGRPEPDELSSRYALRIGEIAGLGADGGDHGRI